MRVFLLSMQEYAWGRLSLTVQLVTCEIDQEIYGNVGTEEVDQSTNYIWKYAKAQEVGQISRSQGITYWKVGHSAEELTWTSFWVLKYSLFQLLAFQQTLSCDIPSFWLMIKRFESVTSSKATKMMISITSISGQISPQIGCYVAFFVRVGEEMNQENWNDRIWFSTNSWQSFNCCLGPSLVSKITAVLSYE